MKRVLIIFLAGIALGLGVSFIARRLPVHYAVRSRPVRLAQLSRGNEAFVFIEEQRWGRASNAATETFVRLLPRTVRNIVLAPGLLGNDAIVFHLTGETLERFELAMMGADTHFLISEHRLCVVSGEDATHGASGYCWTGSAFDSLNPNEASELRNSIAEAAITPSDDEDASEGVSPLQREKAILAGQGWDYRHFATSGYKDKSLPIQLDSGQFTLVFHAPPKPAQEDQDFDSLLMPSVSIALSGPGLAQPEQAIYRAPTEWEAVRPEQYLALQFPTRREARELERRMWPLGLAHSSH